MPAPLRLRLTAAASTASSSAPGPPPANPSLIDGHLHLTKAEAVQRPSPTLEGECPYKDRCTSGGASAQEEGAGGGREGAEGGSGWHKLNGWREAMNAHSGGRNLKVRLSASPLPVPPSSCAVHVGSVQLTRSSVHQPEQPSTRAR